MKLFKLKNMRGKILIIVSLLASSLVMNSCLKDKVGLDWTADLKGKMYAEVWRGGFSAMGLAPAPDSVTFKFLVNIATDQPPTEDITVTMAVSEDAMNRYNAAKGTDYKLYPYIDIVDKNLVIKAGTRNAYCHVKVWNAQLLSACDNFMAPIIIESATGGVIPADPLNMGARLMGLPISNPYEGQYHVTGFFHHPTAGTRTIDEVKTLSTVNCKTVTTTVGDLGGYELNIQVNDDNSVTLSGSLSATQPIIQDDTKPNLYDPATKTFTLNYYYVGSGGNRVIEETYVRL
jgi:hypothetical protein